MAIYAELGSEPHWLESRQTFNVTMIGTLLAGRYQLLRGLGSGGFGQTYLAEDIKAKADEAAPGILCVVKQLQPASQAPNFLHVARRLFETEVSTLETLGQHDQIPTLLDHFEADHEFYLVQEFVDGRSLKEEFKIKGRFSEADVIDLLHQVLTILSFVHSQNVIHRDIKPDNLIRRQRDGKLVLIDFGAVKQIRTQLSGPADTQLTVGIGTQGYTPCEQLAGKPRFSSDLYALGMTAIHALSGESPSDWVDDPETTPLQWPTSVSVSPGLELFLRKLVQPSVYRRYGSAPAALADLQRLDQLVPEVDTPQTMPDLRPPPGQAQPWWWRLTAPVMAIALLFGVRQLGGFMPPELAVYDWLVYQQPELEPDPRLLLVEITEADLQRLQRPTPSDTTLAQVIKTLQGYNPRVIGLDMHRELPQGEGHDQLLETLQAPNLVAIFSIGSSPDQALPPPETVPPERVGFNDIPVDYDGVIRRTLLFADGSNETDAPVYYSFSLRLVSQYLAAAGIEPQPSQVDPEIMQLEDTVFWPLTPNFGGYQGIDARGYQLLLDYRSPDQVARRVSLTQVLQGPLPSDWVNDKVVLIGTTAPSAKDLFSTPYSSFDADHHQMAGVTLHSQITSQLLSAVLDQRPLPWSWPEAVDSLWFWLWGLLGGSLGLLVSSPWWRGLAGTLGGTIIVGVSVLCFQVGGWIPLVAPLAVFGVSAVVATMVRRGSLPVRRATFTWRPLISRLSQRR